MMRVVLDTNCLIASLSKRGRYYRVWKGLQLGEYVMCVSNEILLEYAEIIAQKTSPLIADNVIEFLLNSPFVEQITPYYRFQLISSDPDDNKFVDCALTANAKYIVTNDAHFNEVKKNDYFNLTVLNLCDFMTLLQGKK